MRLKNVLWISLVVCSAVTLMSCGEKATDTDGGDGDEAFDVEIENFTHSFDIPGSDPVHRPTCSTASGGRVVAGLDRPDEWIEIPFPVPGAGTYKVTIRYAAPKDSVIAIRMTGASDGSSGQADFTLDEGERTG